MAAAEMLNAPLWYHGSTRSAPGFCQIWPKSSRAQEQWENATSRFVISAAARALRPTLADVARSIPFPEHEDFRFVFFFFGFTPSFPGTFARILPRVLRFVAQKMNALIIITYFACLFGGFWVCRAQTHSYTQEADNDRVHILPGAKELDFNLFAG